MASKIKLSVTEDLQYLKRLFHKHPVHLHSRIQMLYLIKSGVTDSTKVLCNHLLVGPKAIQRWKNDYLEGGIDLLLSYTNLLNNKPNQLPRSRANEVWNTSV